MEAAWLNSLTDSWVSQSGPDASQSPPTQTTKSATKTDSTTPSSRGGSGHLFGSARRAHDPSSANSSNVLSERSVNDINIFGSRRAPSKLSNEFKIQDVKESQSRGRPSRRSVSASSLGSVVHNTVERKPHSSSPGKGKTGDAPEYWRRLVLGEIAYGEQRDLFTSARTGLENIFEPPAPKARGILSAAIEEEDEDDGDDEIDGAQRKTDAARWEQNTMQEESGEDWDARRDPEMANDMTMPSSPPIRSARFDSSNLPDESVLQQLPQQPRAPSLEAGMEEGDASTFEKRPAQGDDGEYSEQDRHDEHSNSKISQNAASSANSASYDGSQIHYTMERESRIASGQSVLRNESFSAIMISPEKKVGEDGAVFGPVELPPGELKRRLENLRWNQMKLADDADHGAPDQSASIGGKFRNADNTDDYEKMGGFINFRRGGRSADGSFRDRPLSPPIGNDTSEMLPEESLQASTPKQFTSVRIEIDTASSRRNPALPRAPNPSPEKHATAPHQERPATATTTATGSPLKLFGVYDTYTNQTLMRRISQFEEQMSNGSLASADRSTSLYADEPPKPKTETAAATNTARKSSGSRQSSAQFGAGELDGFEFADEQLSRFSHDGADDNSAKLATQYTGALFSSVSSGKKPGELHIQRMRRSRGPMSSRPSTAETGAEPADAAALAGKIPQLATPRRVAEIGSEGKRPRTSPSKDPTPKRRRTLHESDVAFGIEAAQTPLDSVHISHQTMQSVLLGRERRDALGGDELQIASPEALANRGTPRPRTPTPGQRSSVQREQHPGLEANQSAYSDAAGSQHGSSEQQDDSSFRGDNGDGSAAASWSDSSLAGPSGPATGPVADGERKPSIRTEDFMNEAHKVMAMLRNRGLATQGGLASVEESEMETPVVAELSEDDDASFQESTKEPFSRPPSREGKPVQRLARMQEDPELVERLRKYEERSDLGDIMTTTSRYINLAQDAIRAEKQAAQAVQDTIGTFRGGRTRLDESEEMSDPPNIRIHMNPRRQHEQQRQGSGLGDEVPSQASQRSVSSGPSTGRSIPTGSSRGSESRKTIAPQTVSHLIPEEVNGMVFDRNRKTWFKSRAASDGAPPSTQPMHCMLPSEGSEADPFADISDLPVDATLELQTLKPPVASPVKPTGPVLITESNFATSDPQTARDGFGGPQPSVACADTGDAEAANTGVEHEISIDEGRGSHASSPSRKRHLAISFSSPIASIIQDFVVEDDSDSKLERSAVDEPIHSVSTASIRRGRRTVSVKFTSTAGSAGSGSAASSIRSRSASRGASRTLSVAGQTFFPRPVSRIDEREEDDASHARAGLPAQHRELSLVGERSELAQVVAEEASQGNISELVSQRQASLSVLVTTPGPASRVARVDDEQVLAQYVGMLSLSPMSEFTIHQERSLALEASYVLGDRHLVTGDSAKAVMSQSLRGLVERLAEVEPYEPYWEDVEELDLQGKALESLHKLDEFCPQLVTLDAAGNSLRSLNGVPATVRHLQLDGNQLSELTSWSRLANLQYIDVSNNDIKTLSGLRSLVHLRGVKADNCNLADLDGLRSHDGIQTLRARGNQIRAIDFAGTRLQKLVELDLENNQIATVSNLDQLASLTTLNLRRNALDAFTPSAVGGALLRLRTLNVSDCQLTALDVRALPSLRVLFADRNRLARVRGFSKTPRLDSVSLREQILGASERLDISSLYHAYEIRKLYLSGNVLASFDPPVDFLNLQLLELANCGLTSLPATLGQAVPNLRKVNLNFNALTDLRSLSGVPRLKKVLAAGNRIAHAFSVIQTLAEFVHLAEVDLRDNPVTQGFYAHAQAPASCKGGSTTKGRAGSDGTPDSAALTASPPTQPEPFTLPAADAAQDKTYCSRLDLATGMRRRVYSQVFADACGRLQWLDGLAADRTLGGVRDAVWSALNARGIVGSPQEDEQHEQHEHAQGAETNEEAHEASSRWGAEDTFA